MFQKFNTDTLGSRFIKSLLAQTPIPVFSCVVNGDNLIAGCYYVYRRYIIKCESSGILAVSENDVLYPSDNLYPSEFLFVGTGYKAATFYVKSFVDSYDPKYFSTYESTTNYYDSETHYHLGRYLRYLFSTTGLNLLPFYNTHASMSLTDVALDKNLLYDTQNQDQRVYISRVFKQTHKVVAIPIMFNRSYTIALDCPTEVLMRACIRDKNGYVEESLDESNNILFSEDLIDQLRNSGVIYSRCRFHHPVSFRIECPDKQSYNLQRNLYLLIQLPIENDSSIVVLENYDEFKLSTNHGIRCNSDGVALPPDKVTFINSSLLRMNTHCSFAFSDRLIEYLLGNIIYEGELISQNIAKVQTALSKLYPEYRNSFIKDELQKGIWDNNIQSLVLDLVEDFAKDNLIYDQDGYVNKDVETILLDKGGLY